MIKLIYAEKFEQWSDPNYIMSFSRKRNPENLSAYSVFNPNCQTIQGTLTGEQFDKEIRHQLPTA